MKTIRKERAAKLSILILLLFALLFMGCGKTENEEQTKEIENEEVKNEKNSEDITVEEYKADNNSINKYFFKEMDRDYIYDVDFLLYEDIATVPLKVTEEASYEGGNVYSINIIYGDCEGRYFWDKTDRFNLGMFYVTQDNIYLITDVEEVPSEDDFLSDGIIVCSEDDSVNTLDGQRIKIENDADVCKCTISNTLTESGFYCEYDWKKSAGLSYFRSGYGAEGDPIEIHLQDDKKKVELEENNTFSKVIERENDTDENLASYIVDLDNDGNNEAFVVDGYPSDYNDSITPESNTWEISKIWFVDEAMKAYELDDLFLYGERIDVFEEQYVKQIGNQNYLIINGKCGAEGIGTVYTVSNDKLINTVENNCDGQKAFSDNAWDYLNE